MFLRYTQRIKDGKAHRYWSIVENRRGAGKKVIQCQVLYLGEINDSQQAGWCRSIEVFKSGSGRWRQVALFPEDREAPKHRSWRMSLCTFVWMFGSTAGEAAATMTMGGAAP